MLTGELRNRVDKVWEAFWTGGIANPLTVIEQITYLLFIKRLDELETREELKTNMLRGTAGRNILARTSRNSGGAGSRISLLKRCTAFLPAIRVYLP